jgi:two-component system, NarL family, sensor histidine kinase DevS
MSWIASSAMDQHLPTTAIARLVDAAASVVAETDLPAVLRRVAETARQLTGARYAALGVIGEYGVFTEFIHVGLEPGAADLIGHLPTGKGILGLLIRDRVSIRLDQISSHSESYGFPPNHPPMGTFLGVPVRVGPSIFGNIYLTDKEGGFTEDDEAAVDALAVIAGAAVGTARLRQRLDTLALVEDRERIARDVHDSIVQDLFAVGLALQTIAARSTDTGLTTDLEAIADRVDGSISSLRALIMDLRRDEATDDLTDLVREMLAELSGAFGTEVAFEVNHPSFNPSGRLLDDILAIAKEATSNALRHSHGDQIMVRIDQIGDHVMVSISDNGGGFDTTSAGDGFGLTNIEARAVDQGGTMEISSAAGKGTVLEVVLPIPPP